MEPTGFCHSLRRGEGKVLTARLKTRDMELSLPLVVDDEIDAKTEGALADDFDRTWDED